MNPPPLTFWMQWGPYITTIGFMIVAFRGVEPVSKFLYEYKKKKRDVSGLSGVDMRVACVMNLLQIIWLQKLWPIFTRMLLPSHLRLTWTFTLHGLEST